MATMAECGGFVLEAAGGGGGKGGVGNSPTGSWNGGNRGGGEGC